MEERSELGKLMIELRRTHNLSSQRDLVRELREYAGSNDLDGAISVGMIGRIEAENPGPGASFGTCVLMIRALRLKPADARALLEAAGHTRHPAAPHLTAKRMSRWLDELLDDA